MKRTQAHPNTIYHCLYNYFFCGKSKKELTKIFAKSKSTIDTWIRDFRSNTSPARKKLTKRVFRKFGLERRSWLVNLYEKQPILYLHEAAQLFYEEFHTKISPSSVSVILYEAGLSYKVLEYRARQIQTTDILRFCEDLLTIPWILDNLVFIDEVSFNYKDCLRKRGYGRKGKPLVYNSNFSRGKRLSLLCFFGIEGCCDTLK